MVPLCLDMGVGMHADKYKNTVVTNFSMVTTRQQFCKKGKFAQSLHYVETLCASRFAVVSRMSFCGRSWLNWL